MSKNRYMHTHTHTKNKAKFGMRDVEQRDVKLPMKKSPERRLSSLRLSSPSEYLFNPQRPPPDILTYAIMAIYAMLLQFNAHVQGLGSFLIITRVCLCLRVMPYLSVGIACPLLPLHTIVTTNNNLSSLTPASQILDVAFILLSISAYHYPPLPPKPHNHHHQHHHHAPLLLVPCPIFPSMHPPSLNHHQNPKDIPYRPLHL